MKYFSIKKQSRLHGKVISFCNLQYFEFYRIDIQPLEQLPPIALSRVLPYRLGGVENNIFLFRRETLEK